MPTYKNINPEFGHIHSSLVQDKLQDEFIDLKNIETSENKIIFKNQDRTFLLAHQIADFNSQTLHRLVIIHETNHKDEIIKKYTFQDKIQGNWFGWRFPCFAEFHGRKFYAFTSYFDGDVLIETPLEWNSDSFYVIFNNPPLFWR